MGYSWVRSTLPTIHQRWREKVSLTSWALVCRNASIQATSSTIYSSTSTTMNWQTSTHTYPLQLISSERPSHLEVKCWSTVWPAVQGVEAVLSLTLWWRGSYHTLKLWGSSRLNEAWWGPTWHSDSSSSNSTKSSPSKDRPQQNSSNDLASYKTR